MVRMTGTTTEPNAGGGAGPRILLIEDDPAHALRAADVLERSGYEVVWKAHPTAAIEGVRTEVPDIVITDGKLESTGANGLMVAHEIRVLAPFVLIILWSIWVSGILPGLRPDEAFFCGIDAVRDKPLLDGDILALVADVQFSAPLHPQLTGSKPRLRFGPLEIDVGRECVWVDGHLTPMTPRELRLLIVLTSQSGTPICAQKLMEAAWGFSIPEGDALIAYHVQAFKERLTAAGQAGWAIEEVDTATYMFRCE